MTRARISYNDNRSIINILQSEFIHILWHHGICVVPLRGFESSTSLASGDNIALTLRTVSRTYRCV